MNISTSFQPVGSVALHGKLPRFLPPFLTVWRGQTERKASLCKLKLHATRFYVCIRSSSLINLSMVVGRFFFGMVVRLLDFGWEKTARFLQ